MTTPAPIIRAGRVSLRPGFVQEAAVRHDRFESGRHTSGHLMSILRAEWEARRLARE